MLHGLYTSDFQYSSVSCHLQKYSDESSVVGNVGDRQEGKVRALL